MNARNAIFLLLFCTAIKTQANLTYQIKELFKYKQVVVWGHKLHSHTHSYIHNAFFNAFKYLNIPVIWLDNKDKTFYLDLHQSLFITEGQVDMNMPILDDSFYILHNCNLNTTKYKQLLNNKNYITLQVFTYDCLKAHDNLIMLAPYIYCNPEQRIIYMPWATDIFPEDINLNIEKVKKANFTKKKIICWIGTIGDGIFGNRQQLFPFFNAAKSYNINVESCMLNKSIEENQNLVFNSLLAPAIQGEWQVQKGYIPCRIFKNISYGSMGITNSYAVYELFNKNIVYNCNTYQLFFDAMKNINNIDNLIENMEFVRDHHTYLNRILALLQFINLLN